MFKPIQVLAKRSFKQNKGRNLVAISAIVLTTIMFTTLFVLTQSMDKNSVEMAFRQSGYDAHVSFKSISQKDAEKIAAHKDVKEAGQSIVLGVAENKELAGHQVEIRFADTTYASHSFSYPTTGTMPKALDEIALDTLTLKRLGVSPKLGQTVTLEWRKDFNEKEMTSSTFKLSGFWEGNESLYASMAWVSREYAEKMISNGGTATSGQILGINMAHISLYSDKNIEAVMNAVLKDLGLTSLEYNVNLAYSPEINAQIAQEKLPMYLGMILVFVAGYLIIYNIFQISVSTDIQFYGKLKTLGTTKKQLKRLIYGQANQLCIIGIPIGILFGYILGIILVPLAINWNEGQASVSASPIIFIGSALFAWLTVIISCLRPARLAGKVSPVEALRYTGTESLGNKKAKRARNGATITAMAWSNLGRNKKRTVTVICSLTLGLVLLSCLYAKNTAFDLEKYLSDLTIADFMVEDATSNDYRNGYKPAGNTISPELVNEAASLDGLENTGKLYSHHTEILLNQQAIENLSSFYTTERLNEWADYDSNGAKALEEALQDKKASSVIFGAEGIPLETITQENYLLAGSFDPDAFASGSYILAISPRLDKETIKNHGIPTYSVGDQVNIEDHTYTIMAIVGSLSPVTDGALEEGKNTAFTLDFILPASCFQKQWPQNTLRKLYINVEDASIEAAQAMLDGLPVTSRQTMAEQYQQETLSSTIMGNAISCIIALVGVLNFINSMVTAIVSRKQEFAMIQSVGMSKAQLKKMLISEGLNYALLTLAASYIISALAVGIGVRSMVEGGFTTFHFTLMPLLALTPVLLLLAVIIPILCFKNLEEKSLVERLRLE